MWSDARGFSLLEILVAFGVLALALSVALPLLGEGLSGGSRAERRTAALLFAQSKLAEVAAGPLRPEVSRGEAGPDLQWQATIAPFVPAEAMLSDSGPAEAMAIEVVVGGAENDPDAVRLYTVRLRPRGNLR